MAPRNSQEVDCERAEWMVSLPTMMEHRAASQEPGGQDSSHSSVQKSLCVKNGCIKTDIFSKEPPELTVRNGSHNS